MRWKYGKLLNNLGNAIEVVCGPAARGGQINQLARAEGRAVLEAAGIAAISDEEDRARRGDAPHPQADRRAQARAGASSWQSLARGTGSIESDFLNGEIVLLGRQHGVATPVNELLQRLAVDLARAPATSRRASCRRRLPRARARLTSRPASWQPVRHDRRPDRRCRPNPEPAFVERLRALAPDVEVDVCGFTSDGRPGRPAAAASRSIPL